MHDSPSGAMTIGPTTRSPWLILLSTSLAVFAVFLDTTIGFVTFPAISAQFHAAGAPTLSWVLNAYTLVFAMTLIPAGRIADRVGRRRMFLIGVVVFTTGSVACGLSPSVGVLIVAEMVEAVGAAILVPASLALVLQTFPVDRVPMAVATWGGIGAAAGAAGPTLGALLVTSLSWRWAFFVNVPVGLASWWFARRVLPEGRETHPGRLPDALSVALLTGGVGAITFAIVKSTTWGWASATFTAVLAAGLVAVGLFVARSRRVANPLVDLRIFRITNVRWANAAMVVFAAGFSAMFLGNVLFLTRVWGYSILEAGAAISVGPLIVACTARGFGKLAGRVGQRRLLIPGGLLWASGGLLLIARATVVADYVGVYLPSIVLTGIGVALCLPQLSSAAVQGLPPAQFGAGSAVSQSLRNFGATFGVALTIAFTSQTVGGAPLDAFHHVWWLLVGCGITVSVAATRLRRPAAVPGEVVAPGEAIVLD